MNEISQDVIIRPSLRNVRMRTPQPSWLVGLVPGLGLAVAMGIKGARTDHGFVWLSGALVLGIVIVVAIIGAIGEWLNSRNATLFAVGDQVGMTDLWGQRSAIARLDLARVMLATEQRSMGGSRAVQAPVTRFVARDGTVRFKVYGREYAFDDLQKLCAAVGVPLEGSW